MIIIMIMMIIIMIIIIIIMIFIIIIIIKMMIMKAFTFLLEIISTHLFLKVNISSRPAIFFCCYDP